MRRKLPLETKNEHVTYKILDLVAREISQGKG
jgi:hypothetical protein